jgi:hypothetical protein
MDKATRAASSSFELSPPKTKCSAALRMDISTPHRKAISSQASASTPRTANCPEGDAMHSSM